MRFFIIICLVVCAQQTRMSSANITINYVAIIFRHGDRTPVKPYPKDPWANESLWPDKFGQLTNIGKKQHYEFGQLIRKRYSNLISTKFNPSEVYIKSTDVDRTLMSAQVNLAGMYPPVGKSVWNEHLNWQPIPVHTVPQKQDEILSMMKPCPTYEKDYVKLQNSAEYKARLATYNSLMNYMTEHTGTEIKDYRDIEYIYNTLTIEKDYGFKLPNWTDSVYPDEMKEPACYSFQTESATPNLARLKVGPLFREIIGNIIKAVGVTDNELKMSVYSAHDDTIGNVLTAMGLFDGNCPVYTSAIFFELHGDGSNLWTYFVRIMYRNTTGSEEPHALDIPGCGESCDLAQFLLIYDNLYTVDWERECTSETFKITVIILVLMLGIAYCIHLAYRLHKIVGVDKNYSDCPTISSTITDQQN